MWLIVREAARRISITAGVAGAALVVAHPHLCPLVDGGAPGPPVLRLEEDGEALAAEKA